VLRITDEDEFVAQMGPQPPNFQAIVNLNTGQLLTAGVELLPLSPRQVGQQRAAGGLIVDVHRPAVRRGAHPRIGLHPDAQRES